MRLIWHSFHLIMETCKGIPDVVPGCRFSEILYRGGNSMTKGRLFFRRLNRGLALGVILVLAVVLYTVITGQSFRSADKPEIEAMAETYLSDLAAFHVNFEEQVCGHELTEEEIDARMKEFSDFIAPYFAYKRSGALSGVAAQNIDEIMSAYREYLKEGTAGEILSLELTMQEAPYGITITKTGPRNATAFLNLDGVLQTRGIAYQGLYVPGSSENWSYIIAPDGYYQEDGASQEDPSKIYESRCAGCMMLYLEKIDGEWKIVYVGNAYISVYETRLIEGGTKG